MGRPTSITFESVSLAAEKLIAEQKPCKLTDIHGIVGGSLSTVSKYWKMWKEKNGTEVLKQPQGSGPTAQLNDVFTAELNLQISLIHEKYEAKFQEKDAELEYIQSALETSESQVDELNNNWICSNIRINLKRDMERQA